MDNTARYFNPKLDYLIVKKHIFSPIFLFRVYLERQRMKRIYVESFEVLSIDLCL